jgi:DtxR family Mn-dependent transcriptional regulator
LSKAAGTPPQPPQSELSESLEDYLEAILDIEGEKQAARPKDIALRLQVAPPSVTAALQNLGRRGLVNYAPYDVVTLTPRGRYLARDVRRRHDALERFFGDFLQLDPSEADDLACRMEHQLSPQALKRLVKLMDFIETCPHSEIPGLLRGGLEPRVAERGDAEAGHEHSDDHPADDHPADDHPADDTI